MPAYSTQVLGDFTGGQVSYAKPRLLADNQWPLLQNMQIEITGQGSTRFGTAYLGITQSQQKVIGLFYLNGTTVQEELMMLDNGTVYKLSGGTWSTASSTLITVSTSGVPSMVQGANNLYLATGVEMFAFDGTATAAVISGNGSGTNEPAPRNANILLWFTNRLIAAGAGIKSYSTDTVPVPDAMYFSDILDATKWGSPKGSRQLRVGAGDGQAITAMVPWTQFNIAVFKRRSVWVVNADPTVTVANMPITLVHGTVGCVAQKTPAQVGADILFLADDGIRSLSAAVASDQREELSVPLSYPVQDYINRINWAAAVDACAIFWRNLYIIALPLDSSTTNNFVLVYNTITKSWAGVWTNLPINVFAVRLVGGNPRLMAGFGTADRVIEYLDYVLPANWVNSTFQDYDASAVQPRVLTKSFMLSEPINIKLGKGGEIEWNNSDGTLSVTPILDEVRSTTVQTINVSSGGFVPPIVPPFFIAPSGLARARFDLMQYGEWRELQFDILGLTGGRKELRQLATAGFVRPSLVGNS